MQNKEELMTVWMWRGEVGGAYDEQITLLNDC